MRLSRQLSGGAGAHARTAQHRGDLRTPGTQVQARSPRLLLAANGERTRRIAEPGGVIGLAVAQQPEQRRISGRRCSGHRACSVPDRGMPYRCSASRREGGLT